MTTSWIFQWTAILALAHLSLGEGFSASQKLADFSNKTDLRATPTGFFILDGEDPQFYWKSINLNHYSVQGALLILEFEEPLAQRGYWEFYWGSSNEGAHEGTKVFFTAGRRGDNFIKVWLPLNESSLYRNHPFGDLVEVRINPPRILTGGFRVHTLQLFFESPHDLPSDVELARLFQYHTPESFLRAETFTDVSGRILRDWFGNWTRDPFFIIFYLFTLGALLWGLRRLARSAPKS